MPKYPNNYYLTRQEIEDLRADAKQASKIIKACLMKLFHALKLIVCVKNSKNLNL